MVKEERDKKHSYSLNFSVPQIDRSELTTIDGSRMLPMITSTQAGQSPCQCQGLQTS